MLFKRILRKFYEDANDGSRRLSADRQGYQDSF